MATDVNSLYNLKFKPKEISALKFSTYSFQPKFLLFTSAITVPQPHRRNKNQSKVELTAKLEDVCTQNNVVVVK